MQPGCFVPAADFACAPKQSAQAIENAGFNSDASNLNASAVTRVHRIANVAREIDASTRKRPTLGAHAKHLQHANPAARRATIVQKTCAAFKKANAEVTWTVTRPSVASLAAAKKLSASLTLIAFQIEHAA